MRPSLTTTLLLLPLLTLSNPILTTDTDTDSGLTILPRSFHSIQDLTPLYDTLISRAPHPSLQKRADPPSNATFTAYTGVNCDNEISDFGSLTQVSDPKQNCKTVPGQGLASFKLSHLDRGCWVEFYYQAGCDVPGAIQWKLPAFPGSCTSLPAPAEDPVTHETPPQTFMQAVAVHCPGAST